MLSATVTPALNCLDAVDPEILVRDSTEKNPEKGLPLKLIVAPFVPEGDHVPLPLEVVPELSWTAQEKPPSLVNSTSTPQCTAAQLELAALNVLPFKIAVGPTVFVLAELWPPPQELDNIEARSSTSNK